MSAAPKTQCFMEYFNNRPAFISNCKNFRQHYLETYLEIIKCQPKKEHIIFNIPEIMKVIDSGKNIIVQQVFVDIFVTTLGIVDDLAAQDTCQEYFNNVLNKTGVNINRIVIEAIYEKYPNHLVYENKMLKFLFSLITDKKAKHRNDIIYYLVNYPRKTENIESLYEHIFIKVVDFSENMDNQMRLEILSHFIQNIPKKIVKSKSLEFWPFIRNELISEDRLTRKFAYFILRQMFDLSINEQYLAEFRPDNSELWHVFFTIFETIQEPSSHIVLPSLKLVTKLEMLPSCWVYLLLIQYLKHENRLVVQEALKFVVNRVEFTDTDFLSDKPIAMELIKLTLQMLNNTHMYAKNELNLEELTTFFIPLFDRIKDEILAIQWKSVPWYYVCTSTMSQFNFDIQFNKNETARKKLIKITDEIQNLAIRKYMQNFLKSSLVKSAESLQMDPADTLKLENLNPENLSVEQLKTILLSSSIPFRKKEKFLDKIKFNEVQMIRLLDAICGKSETVASSASDCSHTNVITDKLIEIFPNLKAHSLTIYDFLLIYKLWMSVNYTRNHQKFFEQTILKVPPNSYHNKIFLMKAYLMDIHSVNRYKTFQKFSNNFLFLKCISTIEEVIERLGVDGIYLVVDLIKVS